jgi:hypothetical protein
VVLEGVVEVNKQEQMLLHVYQELLILVVGAEVQLRHLLHQDQEDQE